MGSGVTIDEVYSGIKKMGLKWSGREDVEALVDTRETGMNLFSSYSVAPNP